MRNSAASTTRWWIGLDGFELDGNRGCFVFETISTPRPGLIVRGMIFSRYRRNIAANTRFVPAPLQAVLPMEIQNQCAHQRGNVKPSVTRKVPRRCLRLLVGIQVVVKSNAHVRIDGFLAQRNLFSLASCAADC